MGKGPPPRLLLRSVWDRVRGSCQVFGAGYQDAVGKEWQLRESRPDRAPVLMRVPITDVRTLVKLVTWLAWSHIEPVAAEAHGPAGIALPSSQIVRFWCSELRSSDAVQAVLKRWLQVLPDGSDGCYEDDLARVVVTLLSGLLGMLFPGVPQGVCDRVAGCSVARYATQQAQPSGSLHDTASRALEAAVLEVVVLCTAKGGNVQGNLPAAAVQLLGTAVEPALDYATQNSLTLLDPEPAEETEEARQDEWEEEHWEEDGDWGYDDWDDDDEGIGPPQETVPVSGIDSSPGTTTFGVRVQSGIDAVNFDNRRPSEGGRSVSDAPISPAPTLGVRVVSQEAESIDGLHVPRPPAYPRRTSGSGTLTSGLTANTLGVRVHSEHMPDSLGRVAASSGMQSQGSGKTVVAFQEDDKECTVGQDKAFALYDAERAVSLRAHTVEQDRRVSISGQSAVSEMVETPRPKRKKRRHVTLQVDEVVLEPGQGGSTPTAPLRAPEWFDHEFLLEVEREEKQASQPQWTGWDEYGAASAQLPPLSHPHFLPNVAARRCRAVNSKKWSGQKRSKLPEIATSDPRPVSHALVGRVALFTAEMYKFPCPEEMLRVGD